MSKNPIIISPNIVRTAADEDAGFGEKKLKRGYVKAGPNVGPNAKRGRGGNRKAMKRLELRRADYSRMIDDRNDPTGRKGSGGFHRPGSNQ